MNHAVIQIPAGLETEAGLQNRSIALVAGEQEAILEGEPAFHAVLLEDCQNLFKLFGRSGNLEAKFVQLILPIAKAVERLISGGAQEREHIHGSVVRNDVLGPALVIRQRLGQVGAVLFNYAVERNDDFGFNRLRRAARIAQPVVNEDIRIVAAGDHHIDILGVAARAAVRAPAFQLHAGLLFDDVPDVVVKRPVRNALACGLIHVDRERDGLQRVDGSLRMAERHGEKHRRH